jgi:Cytochrome P460
MNSKTTSAVAVIVVFLALCIGIAFAAQDRYTLKAPNGVAFSEFKGYESWENVAPSTTEDGIKSILANPVMIKAYKEGIPGNGKPFPDGSKIVKIEWKKKTNEESPYSVKVPGALKSVAFIQKDTKRFPDSSGWGYAQFDYDAAPASFKPFGDDSSFANKCYKCHTIVKATDYIFTAYPLR